MAIQAQVTAASMVSRPGLGTTGYQAAEDLRARFVGFVVRKHGPFYHEAHEASTKPSGKPPSTICSPRLPLALQLAVHALKAPRRERPRFGRRVVVHRRHERVHGARLGGERRERFLLAHAAMVERLR